MGVTPGEFYDATRVAIVPMSFCFPGYSKAKADLPPRRECAPLWRARVLAALPHLELVLLVGAQAMRWHLPGGPSVTMTQHVQATAVSSIPRLVQRYWRCPIPPGATQPG